MKTSLLFGRGRLACAAGFLLMTVGWVIPIGSSTAADDSMLQAFRQYKVAWNNHDLETLMGYYTDDATYTDPGTGKLSGPAIADAVQGLFTAFPDFKVQVVSADAVDEDTLAEQWVISGTWKKPFLGGPLAKAKPTGKSFKVPGASFLEWSDGKIRSSIHYYDQMALLTQIGVIPPPDQGAQVDTK